MSVEAVAWAFRQTLPAKPKVVLLALADQADERTGHVCYGKTDIKHIAKKSTVSERSLYRYLAALIRNGYAIRKSGKDRGSASQFWLCLDRTPTELSDWTWNIIPSNDEGGDPEDDPEDPEAGPQDIEGSAKSAEVEKPPEDAQIGRPPLPIRGETRISEVHRDIRPSVEQKQSGFSRKAQDLEIEAAAIRTSAQANNVQVFVIEATRAMKAWEIHRGRPAPRTSHIVDGRSRRGWWFPTLFPPSAKETDSPPDSLSDEDARELAKL